MLAINTKPHFAGYFSGLKLEQSTLQTFANGYMPIQKPPLSGSIYKHPRAIKDFNQGGHPDSQVVSNDWLTGVLGRLVTQYPLVTVQAHFEPPETSVVFRPTEAQADSIQLNAQYPFSIETKVLNNSLAARRDLRNFDTNLGNVFKMAGLDFSTQKPGTPK